MDELIQRANKLDQLKFITTVAVDTGDGVPKKDGASTRHGGCSMTDYPPAPAAQRVSAHGSFEALADISPPSGRVPTLGMTVVIDHTGETR
jgi:hypothetical protein